nr:polyphosphate polymerase domain-containing protein [Nakamurella flavida]
MDIDGQRAFRYASVYFDTADLTCYRLAAHRRPRRFKLRTRTYLDSAETWFEVKTRDVRGRTHKVRRPHTDPRTDRMDAAARAFTVQAAAWPGVAELDFAAVLSNGYLRSTLYLPGDDSRVTVDTGLHWHLPDGAGLARPDLVVVETKSPGRLCAADRVLWRHGMRPSSISKYATGLAALRPDLPATTWRRTLRRLAPVADPLDRAA